MPQSLVKNYLHLTFSTKNRIPLINKEIAPDLHAYLGGITSNLDCTPIQIGGVADHVHLIFLLSQKIALMKYLEVLKSSSSRWMKTKGVPDFYWQDGYGAFSINPTQVEIAQLYVVNQEEHHKRMTFKQELRLFFKKYGVNYDERYVWD